MKQMFDGQRAAKLGTKKNPAILNVHTKKKMKEVESVCKEKGWHYTIELNKKNPVDTSDFDILLKPVTTAVVDKKVGRNEPCTCESGKKYKKCCGK